MSFYFGAKNKTLAARQFAAPTRFLEQLRPRHAAQPEGENFLDQRIDLARPPPCDLPDDLLDPPKDAVRRDARVARPHQAHLHAQVERTLDGVGDALIELEYPQVQLAVETYRMVQQDVRQLALGQDEVQHPLEILAQLVDRIGLVRAQAQNAPRQLGQHLRQQFLEQVFLVLEIEIEGAASDAGARNDIGDVGPMVALAREYSFGVAQHLGAPGLSFHYSGLP